MNISKQSLFQISPEQQTAIEKGRSEIKNGQFFKNEELISEMKHCLSKDLFEPKSIEEFKNRIDQSTEDSKNGRLTENCKLTSEIEKWD